MPKQCINPISHQIPRRFMSAKKKHSALSVDFLFGQSVSLFLDIQEKTDEVAGPVLPAFGDCLGEENSEFDHRILRGPDLLLGTSRISKESCDCVGSPKKVLLP